MRHGGGWLGQAVGQHLRDLGGQVLAAGMNGTHGLDQQHRVARLVGITGRAGLDAAQGVLILGVHGDHDDADLWMGFPYAGQHFQAAAARHVDVQQQHIAGGFAQGLAQLGVAACLGGDTDVCGFGQGVAYASSQDGMVIA